MEKFLSKTARSSDIRHLLRQVQVSELLYFDLFYPQLVARRYKFNADIFDCRDQKRYQNGAKI